ncbi:uncharacterized protein LOC143328089 [Chaetodon auriga]|uniref:uncharacterized protein LOC143328089 n=1 Tax=Chaetodon auriga TaxID=39042 RepID=UPI0040330581
MQWYQLVSDTVRHTSIFSGGVRTVSVFSFVMAGRLLFVILIYKFSFKRTQANVTDDFICMGNLDHGDLSPAGNDTTYSVVTSVPGANCATDTALLNRQEPQNEDSSTYHLYYTISEEPPPSALKDMVYSTVQAH